MNEFNYEGLQIKSPPSWLDVTSDLDSESSPFTLAKSDGFGALQFTVAIYRKGKEPDINMTHLSDLILDFSQSRELREGFDRREKNDILLICAESFRSGNDFIRVWYCSDSVNVILVTYVCVWGKHEQEVAECEAIVSNVHF